MAEPILKLTRGVPKTDREWMDVFRNLAKFFKVSGNSLVIGGDLELPPASVGTDEIEDSAVTDPKLRQSQACSIIGRAANSVGSPTDIQASTNGDYLRRSGNVLNFGAIQDSDLPATIARDTEVSGAIATHEAALDPHPQYSTAAEVASAITAHEGALDPHPVYAREGSATTITGAWAFALPPVLPTYTVATVPSAATYQRGLIYVSDESGGAVLAFSDGTDWRRVTDRAVIS